MLAVAAVLAALVWLRPEPIEEPVVNEQRADPEHLVSAIQPITKADAADLADNIEAGTISGRLASVNLDTQTNKELKNRFERALTDIQAENSDQAIKSLNELISDYPGVPELYANLGALHARGGDLELARQTFKKGLQQDSKSKALFDGLQEVHGALAANAYQKALDATPPNTQPSAVTLPLLAHISTLVDKEQTIAALEAQLSNTSPPDTKAELEKIDRLQSELKVSEQNLATLKSEYEAEMTKLREQLASQSEVLASSQTAEREAQARVVRAEESATAQLKEALAKLETDKQQLLIEKDAIIARQKQELERVRKQAAADQVVAVEADQQAAEQAGGDSDNGNKDQQAVALVESWARVWSAQDVGAYVNHYAQNYSSGNSISREQWLEQRRIRLTNKEFIEVNVSEFAVQDMGDQFAITFTQHYRSNTVDDTIRKRLVFSKDGDDWSKAKIVNESRVKS